MGVPHSGQKPCARLFPLSAVLINLRRRISLKVLGMLAMLARNAVPVSLWQSVQWHTLTVAGSTSAS